MLVWLASMSPLTRCADCAYGDFLDSATCTSAVLDCRVDVLLQLA